MPQLKAYRSSGVVGCPCLWNYAFDSSLSNLGFITNMLENEKDSENMLGFYGQ